MKEPASNDLSTDTSGAIIASAGGNKQFTRGWSGPPNPKARPGQKPVAKIVEVLPPEKPDDPRLVELAGEIRNSIKEFGAHTTAAIEAVISVGEKLLEAKDVAGHGRFLGWVAANCDLSERSVQDYIRIYEHRDQVRAKYAAGAADFSMRSALKALATPRPESDTPKPSSKPTADNRDERILRLQDENAALRTFRDNLLAQKAEKAAITTNTATGADLIADRDRQLADLDAAWERANPAVRQTFFRRINAEAPELSDG
jgi:Protein of unknown function (DUF3102)